LDAIPNLLTLVAGYTYAGIEVVQDTNIAFNAPYASTDTSAHQYLRRLGAILHLTKDISLYGLDSTTFSPQSTSVDVNNRPLPNVIGIGEEVGLKTAFWDGRLTSTFSVFKLQLTNQAVFSGQSNAFGNRYFIPVGNLTTRGWDGDLALALLPGWQVIATLYNATIENQAGAPAANTFGNSWSFFTRYDFPRQSSLKGLSFGGGVNRIGDWRVSTSGVTFPVGFTPPASGLFKVHEGTPVNAFVVYNIDKHWQVRLNGANLLNSIAPVGAQAAEYVDPEPPRTILFTLSYEF
jgi:outer membrane receptor for ferric coprogen and ferric-rhodotorulic acid